jgi:hypothetical protein
VETPRVSPWYSALWVNKKTERNTYDKFFGIDILKRNVILANSTPLYLDAKIKNQEKIKIIFSP